DPALLAPAPAPAEGAEYRAAKRRDEHQAGLGVAQVGLRLGVHDLEADQDKAAEDEAADRPANEAVVRGAVLDPAEEAARDRERHGQDVVDDLVPAEREPGDEAEHHRHDDSAGDLNRERALVEGLRELHAPASLTEIDSCLPSISVLSESPCAPSKVSEVARVSPAT